MLPTELCLQGDLVQDLVVVMKNLHMVLCSGMGNNSVYTFSQNLIIDCDREVAVLAVTVEIGLRSVSVSLSW